MLFQVTVGDGCSMGGLISVVFSDICVSEKEEDIIAPMKLHFKKRYGDDTNIQRKKNELLSFFEKLNSSHSSIKSIIRKNLKSS